MNKKVVITGLNIISSLGLNAAENWENLIQGKSGVKRITLFDASKNGTQIAAQVPDDFEEISKKYIRKRSASQMTRVTRMCFVCAKDAITDANINFTKEDKSRCGVILGVVNTGNTSSEKETTAQNRILKSMNNAMSAWISLEFELEGPNYTVASACSSSAFAIGLGYDLIKSNRADIMIVGGADSIINFEEIEGFNELYALSTNNDRPEKACCPFTKDRDGFVIGEGAGILVLESEEHAKARGAAIYAEMPGYAITSEAYNIMAPMKDGEGMAKTMAEAIRDSGISVDDVNYINAHGTSTLLNDKYETLAVKKVFGEKACHIPVSSSKSMIGHTIGAAGVIEAAITVLSIKNEYLTPTINYDNPDPELDLDYVPNQARKYKINCALSNSFAFGGHNATLIFRRHQ
ncbi:MAG: beta-ketoacyl-[acyl-carrier-protein] synthase family protein [Bacteroidota bacterium]